MTAVSIFSEQASVFCQKHSDPFVILSDTKNKELNNIKKHRACEQTHFPVVSTTVAESENPEVDLTGEPIWKRVFRTLARC